MPAPLPIGIRILPRQRIRQLHVTKSGLQVAFMQAADTIEMSQEALLHARRQHRHAVPVPLAFSHEDLASREVNVFDPQPQTFHQPQPRTVEQHCHDPRNPVKRGQQRLHLRSCEHGRQPLCGRFARTTSSSQPGSRSNTSL